MTIERISAEDFPSLKPGSGPCPSAESAAFMKLELGAAFRTPCRWNHYSNGSCGGTLLIGSYARSKGAKARTTCQDGTFYAMRVG